jgi:hypothetical protein
MRISYCQSSKQLKIDGQPTTPHNLACAVITTHIISRDTDIVLDGPFPPDLKQQIVHAVRNGMSDDTCIVEIDNGRVNQLREKAPFRVQPHTPTFTCEQQVST